MASGLITSWQIEGGKWKQSQTIFLRSNITVNCDFKICFLLQRKAMTNLDSVLKSRHITLLAISHIVKDIFFPVVM